MVLICLNPFLSHFLPIRSLASNIVKNGEDVVFMGYPSLKEIVERDGYRYVLIESSTDETLQKYKRNHEFDKLENEFKQIHEEITDKIKALSPRLVLFHISRFDVFFLPVYLLGIKYMTYDMSFGKVSFSLTAPPSTSSIIPVGFWDIRSVWGWIKRLHRKVKDLKWLTLRRKYPYREINIIRKENKLKRGFCIDGFYIKGSHIKFTPRRVEFRTEKNIYYAGLCVEKTGHMKEKTVITKEKGTQLIYCTLGTMSNRYVKTRQFLEGLIEIMRKHQNIQLIISLGKKNDVFETDNLPDNVKIYDYVNQHEILKKADLVITHGGAGTVKECIHYEVPMVIAPSSYDQIGNAAKVQFHNIGLQNKLMKRNFWERKTKKRFEKMNTTCLEKQILRVLGEKEFKENIKNYNKKIEKDKELEIITHHICD